MDTNNPNRPLLEEIWPNWAQEGAQEAADAFGPFLLVSIGASRVMTTALGGATLNDAVYVDSSDHVARADNNGANTWPAVGFVSEIISTTRARVQFAFPLGGFVGLTPGATYYLGATPGTITLTAPTSSATVQRVGVALTATILLIQTDDDFEVLV